MSPWSFFWQNSLASLVSLGLLLVVATVVSSVRHEPDPKGRRVTATYLSVVLFFSLFTALLAGTAAVASTAEALVGDGGSGVSAFSDDEFADDDDFEDEEGNEDEVAAAVRSLLLAGVAGAVLAYHRRRLLDLVAEDREGPAARVAHGYLYVASAVALLTFVMGASMGLFGFAKVIAPDSLSTQEIEDARDEGAREVFTWGFLAVASLAVVGLHQLERDRVEGNDLDGDDDEDDDDDAGGQDLTEYPIA